MAAINLLPSPQHIQSPMASNRRDRVPLSNLPNATNSPFRAAAAVPGTKRARSQADNQRDFEHAQPPPAKKQMLNPEEQDARRHAQLRKAGYNPAGARGKLEALPREAGSRPSSKASDKIRRAAPDNLETIRQWQRHYQKLFPEFVFYYESIPDEKRALLSRQVQALGSREEVFFSKDVTHIITTRPIPAELTSSSSAGSSRSPGTARSNGNPNTINPLLLETQQLRGKFTFEAAVPKRGQIAAPALASNDILYRAREMGIKIWSLGKLDRMLATMFNNQTGEGATLIHSKRSATTVSTRKEGDFKQLLQREKQHTQTTQDWRADMAPFRGYYVYIHDMDEQTRPVMIRDYPRPQTKEAGKWPQLRPNGPGRCPFLNDPTSRAQAEHTAERAAAQPSRTTRAASAAAQTIRQGTPAGMPERAALAENNNLAHRGQRAASTQPKDHVQPLDPPKSIPIKRAASTDTLPLFGSAQASLRHHPRFAGGEPVASGLQQSNITSAIKSQMISSTAAAPGAKTGTTKKLNLLNRQVLERNSVPSNSSMSYNLNDVRAAINNDRPRADSKRKAQDLAHIKEEDTHSEEEEQQPRRVVVARKKKRAEKELKPGYCENCRTKFDDFDEHVKSKQHRKFATTPENWTLLDDLLRNLVRPKKEE